MKFFAVLRSLTSFFSSLIVARRRMTTSKGASVFNLPKTLSIMIFTLMHIELCQAVTPCKFTWNLEQSVWAFCMAQWRRCLSYHSEWTEPVFVFEQDQQHIEPPFPYRCHCWLWETHSPVRRGFGWWSKCVFDPVFLYILWIRNKQPRPPALNQHTNSYHYQLRLGQACKYNRSKDFHTPSI